jgi:hypothetical protein
MNLKSFRQFIYTVRVERGIQECIRENNEEESYDEKGVQPESAIKRMRK